MRSGSVSSQPFMRRATVASRIDRLARQALLDRLARITDGQLTVRDDERAYIFGDRSAARALCADITITDSRFYGDVAAGGTIGAAEAYVRGYWHTSDLTRVVRLLLRNRDVLEQMEAGLARLAAPLHRLFHYLQRNSRRGSRRNIAAHYDIGNEFFSLWLDNTMMYSAAVFDAPDTTLEAASVAKLERICRKLQLGPTDRVVEIGTGWGGFALHAAGHYGCHVTTTTISREQHDYARARIAAAGLEDRITLLCNDYRELEGSFDKLVSIEMIEAVGHEYYDTFFDTCKRLLVPDGLMCLQSITIADQQYNTARRSVDFIKRYIFPGGCLPSVTALLESATRSSDLRLVHAEDIGPHYATTLSHWRTRFLGNLDAVRKLGHTPEFIRLWLYYLSYCEGAFLERAIGNVQMLMARPDNRRPPYPA